MNRLAVFAVATLLGMMIASPVAAQSAPAKPPPEKKTATRGNVLLITVDSLRSDRLDPYIGKSNLTPAIGELATRGMTFTRAYATSPSTAPSTASILTGYYPSRHGIRHDLGGYLADGIETLAERLQRAGYTTGAVVGSFHLDSDRRLDRGFGSYDDDIEGVRTDYGTLSKERRAETVIDKGLGFLDAAPKGKPWFLWLNLYDPHHDFRPPEIPLHEFMAESYPNAIADVDAQIAILDEALRVRRLWDSTHFILAGSHGEGLGDHDEIGHGIYLFETTIRVPLIVVKAGPDAAGRGSMDDNPVSLLDLAPTILDLAGVSASDSLEGRSLVPLLAQDAEAARSAPSGARKLYAEAVQPHEAYGWSPLYAVLQGDRKIVQGRRLEAFDLGADPGERHPLDPAPGWSASLESFGRKLLGQLPPSEKERRAILSAVEALNLPWANSPICLDKQNWPDPRDPDRLRLNGALFEARVNFDHKAVGLSFQAGQEILAEDPANYTALEMVIFLYVRNGFGDMIPDVIEIFQCNYPFRTAPYHYYGHFLDRMERYDQAEKAFRMLGRIDPLLEDGPYDLAAIYARTGREDEAIKSLQKAIDLGATDYDYFRTDPRLAPLWEDPRFQRLIAAPPPSPAPTGP